MTSPRAAPLVSLALLVAACGEVGPVLFSYPVYGAGETPAPVTIGAWSVQLTRAEIGFGPAYFCAGVSAAGDLCRAALSEFAATATIDGLSPEPQPLGTGGGETGEIRSVTYDFAVSWTNLQSEPTALSGSPEGHSAIVEGVATRGADTVTFVVPIDAFPQHQGAHAVSSTALHVTLDDPTLALYVRVQPRQWFAQVDFAALLPSGPDPVVLAPGTPAYEAIRLALMVNRAPAFSWEP